MWTAEFWKSTTEWVLFAALSAFSGSWAAVTLTEMTWQAAGLVTAGAALTMLVKCLGSVLRGNPQSPALVEPPPVVRVVTEPPPRRPPPWDKADRPAPLRDAP